MTDNAGSASAATARRTDWRADLNAAARDSKLPLLFPQDVTKEANARTVISVLKAFGETATGFVYVEPNVARSTVKPPDILLAHPDVGICILEVKSWPLSIIQGIEASHIKVKDHDGYIKDFHVFNQAGECMFQIKDATRRVARKETGEDDDYSLPAFNFFAVFPNISKAEWLGRRYDQCLKMEQIVLADDIDDPKALRAKIERHVRAKRQNGDLLTPEQLRFVRKAIGDSAVVNDTRAPRAEVSETKLGYDIDQFALWEKNLSTEQEELSRADFEGRPQLIRGVAGSGKSIVLANNAANLLIRKMEATAQQQLGIGSSQDKTDPRVGIVCFNRTLVSFLKEKVRLAFEQRRLQNFPAGAIVCNYMNGFMYAFSKETGAVQYQHVEEGNPRSGANAAAEYMSQINHVAEVSRDWYESLLYDCIYVDEGQDFHPEEFQLLLSLLKPHPETGEKSIVIFYDDAQNLYARPRPTWSQIGINVVGGGRSRVMKECFRNSREIVEFAFNVLLGSKADSALRVQTREYADVTYLKENGLVEEMPDRWKVNFTERTHNRPPEVQMFSTRLDEKRWVANKIAWLINNQQVRSEDILVLFEQSGEFSDLDQSIRDRVPGISGFVKPFGKDPTNPDKDSYILRKGFLTLSTTKGAKGYDAFVVFLVGADQFEKSREGRASFYVGSTRAKLMLYVTGRNKPGSLLNEAADVQQMLFQPTYNG
jgi:hypothetical protein